jgi:hypothetical protein
VNRAISLTCLATFALTGIAPAAQEPAPSAVASAVSQCDPVTLFVKFVPKE